MFCELAYVVSQLTVRYCGRPQATIALKAVWRMGSAKPTALPTQM